MFKSKTYIQETNIKTNKGRQASNETYLKNKTCLVDPSGQTTSGGQKG